MSDDPRRIGLLADKKVLITGGSRGIGAACARECHRQGAHVGLVYLKDDGAALSVADSLDGGDGRISTFKADVSDHLSIKEVAERFSTNDGKEGIDGVVVNAGIYRRTPFPDLDRGSWKRTMDINLTGSYNTVKAVIPFIGKGSIVLVSSQVAFRGSDNGADYAASKAGMLGLGRSLARELAPTIRVNMVAPGFVDTRILAGDTPVKRAERISQVPLGRIGSPEDIASPVVFLLSDMSSYITGATIDVNGGLFIH